MEANLGESSVPETKISNFLDLQNYFAKSVGFNEGENKRCTDGSKVFFSPLHEDDSEVKGLLFKNGSLRELEVAYEVPVYVNKVVGGHSKVQQWTTKFIKYRVDSEVHEGATVVHSVTTLTGDRVESVLPVGETLH